MSIESYIHDYLVSNGLWPDEASQVLIDIKKSCDKSIRWSDSTDYYPKELMACLILEAKTQAIKLLEGTNPSHFALGILK